MKFKQPTVAVFLMAPCSVLMGSRCNNDAPACRTGLGDEPIRCTGAQLPACRDFCVTPEVAGSPCDLDPCAGSHRLCGPGLACTGTLTSATCTLENPTVPAPYQGLFCDTNAPQACGAGTVCVAYASSAPFSCPDRPSPRLRGGLPPDVSLGACAVPVREGGLCDGTWNDAMESPTVTHCAPCGPGLECADNPGDLVSESVCLRPCADSTECSCNTGDERRFDTCLGGTCLQCVPDGMACSTNDDCCAAAVCGRGTCVGCADPGATPNPLNPTCCSGRAVLPDTGRCPLICNTGRGTVFQGSSCGSGSCAGAWQCTASNPTADCVPTRGRRPETFNCVDDDCNGRVDDGVDTNCTGPVLPRAMIPNFDGCPNLNLPGRWMCNSRNEPYCNVSTGFCAWDNVGNQVNFPTRSTTCFTGGDVDCSNTGCLVGEWCCYAPSNGTGPHCTEIGRQAFADGRDPVGPRLEGVAGPIPCWTPVADPTNTVDRACDVVDSCIGKPCEACALDPACGFCSDYHACLEGDAEGAMRADCTGDSWIRNPVMCAP